MEGEQLISYACDMFERGKYEEALEAFVLAYCKGYERAWILDNIYACYMEGNENAFRTAYENCLPTQGYSYEECTLDFVPYKEGVYYIFDKEISEFRGVFSVAELGNAELDEHLRQMEFSAVALQLDWNIDLIKPILMDAKTRKIYIICRDSRRAASFYKIPELGEYMKNVMLFNNKEEYQQYFHVHTDVYLPKIVYGNEQEKQELTRIFEEEHRYRLTPEGRNKSNILLTIAIPTCNRGYLLVERIKNLIEMQYDAEIEVTVSRHGPLYTKEYEQAAQMMDERMVYHDHCGTLNTATENWHYSIEMASGKYVLLLSDEDDVIRSALEHYLKILSTNEELGMVRPQSTFQGAHITERKYGKKGLEAFKIEYLHQNYISGLILRRDILLQANVLELERFRDNVFYLYYPHEWWCAAIALQGDCLEEPYLLIVENDSVLKQEVQQGIEQGALKENQIIDQETNLPIYASYEERLKQFRGQIDFLHYFMQDDMQGAFAGLTLSICKVAYLLEMAREYHYKPEIYLTYVDQFIIDAMNAIEEFQLSPDLKVYLLQGIQGLGASMLQVDERMKKEEAEG